MRAGVCITLSNSAATYRDYLRLARLPNVFTAIADVTMGFLFVQGTLHPPLVFGCLLAASVLLYTSGMVLNDVWDVEQDRRERPERPIASGRVSLRQARRIGFALLIGGMLFGWVAGYLGLVAGAVSWRSGAVATLLAVTVVLYDAGLKRTFVGPLAMGSCRLLNVLLGMSVAMPAAGAALVWGYTAAQLLAATGIGVYIVGVTWFARHEAAESRRMHLAAATLVLASGIAVLGLVYSALPAGAPKALAHESTWFLLLGLLALTILRRCAMAVSEPTPRRVQLAVKNAIWSLIVLDAAVALLVSSPAWSLVIVTLLLPTMLLGQWVEST